MRRTELEVAVDAMEKAGWRWAGMSPKAIYFDKKVRDVKAGRTTLEWREFKDPGEIRKFLSKRKRRPAKGRSKRKA